MKQQKDGDLYTIDLPYACAGIIVKNDFVVETAPIFNWMRGKALTEVTRWVKRKKGTIYKHETVAG